jgi:hypothetical protein
VGNKVKAEDQERDALLKQVTEDEIVASVQQTLERARRWYVLHDRPIPATDIGCYLRAFDEILVLDALPDVKPSSIAN